MPQCTQRRNIVTGPCTVDPTIHCHVSLMGHWAYDPTVPASRTAARSGTCQPLPLIYTYIYIHVYPQTCLSALNGATSSQARALLTPRYQPRELQHGTCQPPPLTYIHVYTHTYTHISQCAHRCDIFTGPCSYETTELAARTAARDVSSALLRRRRRRWTMSRI